MKLPDLLENFSIHQITVYHIRYLAVTRHYSTIDVSADLSDSGLKLPVPAVVL